MNKWTTEEYVISGIIFLIVGSLAITLLITLLYGCGGKEGVIDKPKPMEVYKVGDDSQQPHCGDLICNEKEGEDYWNCLDCVDVNGWPKNGYCGDGVCYNESMTSCWKDCRPKQVNRGWDDDFPRGPSGGGPLPDPPFELIDPLKSGKKFPNLPHRGF
jgi:hypothetical protein